MVSHSQDFLNGTCTNILHLNHERKLIMYKGNYATFARTKRDNEIQQAKQYEKQQDEIKHIKKFISSCGTFANAVKQAQSRQKASRLPPFSLLTGFESSTWTGWD
jgi:ATP-binding cassette subfamily F protein 2